MSETIQIKRCLQCKQIKAQSEFSKDKRSKDGLQCYCKQCHNQYIKLYRQRYEAQCRQYQRQYKRNYRKTLRGHLRHIWHAMLHRCNNPKDKRYKDWGGRGIQVKFACFEDFFNYVKELKVEPRGLTIDRIDNDGHYEPGNIRFVSCTENNRNRGNRAASTA